MLRHLRRDRFAPNFTPERERREAAFADTQDNTNAQLPEDGAEGQVETPNAKFRPTDVETALAMIQHDSRESAVDILQQEDWDSLLASAAVRDAFADIEHPSPDVEIAMKVVAEAGTADHLPEGMETVLESPEVLMAAIESLESQSQEYGRLVETMEQRTAGEAETIDQNSNPLLHILNRSDAAEEIRALIATRGQTSVEAWIKDLLVPKQDEQEDIRVQRQQQARVAAQRLQTLLGIPAEHIEEFERATTAQELEANENFGAYISNIIRRSANLLSDRWKRLTFRSERWNPSEEISETEQNQRREGYFAEVERHLASLKLMLKTRLEEKADALKKEIAENMYEGIAETAGVDISSIDIVDMAVFDGDENVANSVTQKYGVTLEDIFEELNATTDLCRKMEELQVDQKDFTVRAQDYLRRLQDNEVPMLWSEAIAQAQKRHATVRSWIPDFQKAYERIRPKLDEDAAASFIAMSTGAKDAAEVRTRLDELAAMMRNPSALDRSELSYVKGTVSRLMPAIEGLLSRDYQRAFALPLKGATPEEFERQSGELSEIIVTIEKDLHASRIQKSNACHTAGIPEKLDEEVRSVKGNILRTKLSYEKARGALETLRADADPDERSTLENLLRAAGAQLHVMRGEIDQLKDALAFINNLPTIEQAEGTETACNGYCDYGQQKIYLNRQRHTDSTGNLDEAKLTRTFDHEFGHLVVDALTERYLVLTGAFNEQQPELERIAKERGIGTEGSLEEMLEEAAGEWRLDRAAIMEDGETIDAHGGPEAYYRRKRWEELLMQYASYREKFRGDVDYSLEKDMEYSAEARELFRLLDARNIQQDHPSHAADSLRDALLSKRRAVAFSSGGQNADLEALMEGSGSAEASTEIAPRVTVGPKLDDFKVIREQIKTIKNFLHTYPQAEAAIGPIYQNAKEGYEQYFRQFNDHIRAYTQDERMPELYFPEEDENLGLVIQNATNALKTVEKNIKDFDAQKMLSVANAQPQGKEFWLWFTKDIQWLSLMDYWTMTTEGWEDIKRLWKRRGENSRGKVGELFTGWIGDKVPYAGQLKHEFHRRQQSSELEAVGVWEKALENVDSYKLIEDLPHVNNQDHLKAVMILLTKRGRLDWDDPELWRALSRFSHFKIPIEECRRDPILLEKWLQKVIADIWSDKDLYRTWKTSNEHSYNSERDKFEGVADFYSNAGLLGPQLEYMLKTFVEAKEKNEPIPDQVNPHLYEQLFLYAMEKGKMSMQQKFFYLIMGLKWKIIPFDRLSIINGKISTSTFPFIDFFYQHNHTEPEILELAESLIEGPNQRFTPGPKTTAFLIEEVAHDEAARQRVTKVISRSGTTIDHEDIPMVTGFMSQGGWNNFLIVSSGAIQRVTPEGLKNAYVGYNTMFKIYGMLAEKKAEDRQSLPPSDIDFLAARIVAFAHFDNVVVRQAIDNNNRPKLSMREIENETMPSGNNKKAKQYRDPMNELSFRVFDAYADQISQILESQGKLLGPEDAPIEGATRQEKYKKYRNMFLGVDDQGRTLNETPFGANHKKGGRIFKMGGEMETAMIEAVKVDKGKKMTDILREMSIRENKFTNEGEEQMNYVVHKNDLGRQKRFEKANGNP